MSRNRIKEAEHTFKEQTIQIWHELWRGENDRQILDGCLIHTVGYSIEQKKEQKIQDKDKIWRDENNFRSFDCWMKYWVVLLAKRLSSDYSVELKAYYSNRVNSFEGRRRRSFQTALSRVIHHSVVYLRKWWEGEGDTRQIQCLEGLTLALGLDLIDHGCTCVSNGISYEFMIRSV